MVRNCGLPLLLALTAKTGVPVASVDMAKLYYAEFKRQMAADPSKRLRTAIIYSYGANEAETDGILDAEADDIAEGLDGIKNTVRAGKCLNQSVHLEVFVHPEGI